MYLTDWLINIDVPYLTQELGGMFTFSIDAEITDGTLFIRTPTTTAETEYLAKSRFILEFGGFFIPKNGRLNLIDSDILRVG